MSAKKICSNPFKLRFIAKNIFLLVIFFNYAFVKLVKIKFNLLAGSSEVGETGVP
jgi:hypothetical protein